MIDVSSSASKINSCPCISTVELAVIVVPETAPEDVTLVAVNACAAIVLPDCAVNVLAVN